MIDEFVIREMAENDVDAVCALDKECMGDDAWPREWFAEGEDGERGQFFTAWLGDELAGFCGFFPWPEKEPPYGKITTLAVRGKYRHKGLARRMLTMFFDRGRELGLRDYKLETAVDNFAAIPLYESLGFRVEERIPNYYDKSGKDALIMWKRGAINVFIVYAHPCGDSFTRCALNSFIDGLKSAGHSFVISDLYEMNFTADMSESEYLREANYDESLPVPTDVLREQEKINASDAIVFIYPVFWTEAPAKLVGWFDRVWTYGIAYGNRKMKKLEKGLVICTAGHPAQRLEEYGHAGSMRTVMLGDRLFDRVKSKEMIILDSMSKLNPSLRQANWDKHLKTAFDAGRAI